jgi:hypothetical protein
MTADPITGDPFHCAALTAFVEEARRVQGWPDSKAVKAKAYRLYEEELVHPGSVTVSYTTPV